MKSWWRHPRFWLGIAFSALFLFLAFRNVQWPELVTALQRVNWMLLAAAVGFFVANLWFRSLRWQALLQPLGHVHTREAFGYINIGYMANNLLPLRAGEIIRCVLIGETKNFSKSAVLATIVVERLLDVLSAGGLALLLMALTPVSPVVKRAVLLIGGTGFLVVLALWWAAGQTSLPQWAQLPTHWLRQHTIGWFDAPLARFEKVAQAFGSGLAAIRSPRQVTLVAAYSLLSWSAVILYTWLVLRACNLDLPLTAALMVTVLVNFGTAIPSSPGFIGVTHFLAVFALSPWAVEQNLALGFAVVFHAIGFLVTVALGLVFLGRESIDLGQLSTFDQVINL